MALDMAKYRDLFLEEGSEHLAEMSRALLELEKSRECADAIDLIFRMAHSLKSMAASLGYDSITDVAHRLEDRMAEVRAAGRVGTSEELTILFRGLEGLETMVDVVRQTGEAPSPMPDLAEALAQPIGTPGPGPYRDAGDAGAKKKTLNPARP